MRKLKLPGRDPSKPKLDADDIRLIQEIGIDGIKEQTRNFVEQKLREQPDNDGEQTPEAGNPVYKAMHACRANSRKELSRAHRIPAGPELKDRQVDAVVNLLVRWIVREYNFYLEAQEHQQDLSEF
jgi:dTDP-4-amino-4,6-dideoxygalactose transaminase